MNQRRSLGIAHLSRLLWLVWVRFSFSTTHERIFRKKISFRYARPFDEMPTAPLVTLYCKNRFKYSQYHWQKNKDLFSRDFITHDVRLYNDQTTYKSATHHIRIRRRCYFPLHWTYTSNKYQQMIVLPFQWKVTLTSDMKLINQFLFLNKKSRTDKTVISEVKV